MSFYLNVIFNRIASLYLVLLEKDIYKNLQILQNNIKLTLSKLISNRPDITQQDEQHR